MKTNLSNTDWAARYEELTASCRLWVAVSEAKDSRIEELEAELEQLRGRVARLSRLVGRRGSAARRVVTPAPQRRRTPTMG